MTAVLFEPLFWLPFPPLSRVLLMSVVVFWVDSVVFSIFRTV